MSVGETEERGVCMHGQAQAAPRAAVHLRGAGPLCRQPKRAAGPPRATSSGKRTTRDAPAARKKHILALLWSNAQSPLANLGKGCE